MWLTWKTVYLISNSCSKILLAVYSPEAMQHNFVLEFHNHSLEKHQLPIELKSLRISPNIKGHRTRGLTYLLGGKGKHVWLIVRQLPMKAGWWDDPLALQDLAVSMTTSKFSCSLIYAQPLPCNTSLRLQIPYTGNPPTPHIYSTSSVPT